MKIRLLLVAGLLIAGVAGAEPLKVGPSKVTVDVGVPLDVFTYKPPTYRGGPIVVVFHGVNRNAEDYRNFAITLAEHHGVIVVAPEFDAKRFPSEAYQRGGITKNGKAQPRENWTYSMVPKLVADLRAREKKPDLPYYLIGHSAGGQFLVRMAALAGALGAERIIAANPGSHLFPTRDAKYGYGFGGLPDDLSNDDAIRRYLAAPLTIYLGTADNKQDDPNLDRGDEAMKQGRFRYERGLACFGAARKLAEERGWEFNWRKVETAGIGHSSSRMFAAKESREAIFGPEKK